MKRWPILFMLCVLPSAVMAADGLGRLFTTPAERASLENLRSISKIPVIDPAIAESSEESGVAVTAPPSLVSVQGYIKRSDGKEGTVWVNHQPMQESSGNSDVQVGKLRQNGNSVLLKFPATGKSLELKAGQVYDSEAGQVKEVTVRVSAASKEKAEESGSIGRTPDAASETNRR
jgi:hypothetical protein